MIGGCPLATAFLFPLSISGVRKRPYPRRNGGRAWNGSTGSSGCSIGDSRSAPTAPHSRRVATQDFGLTVGGLTITTACPYPSPGAFGRPSTSLLHRERQRRGALHPIRRTSGEPLDRPLRPTFSEDELVRRERSSRHSPDDDGSRVPVPC